MPPNTILETMIKDAGLALMLCIVELDIINIVVGAIQKAWGRMLLLRVFLCLTLAKLLHNC